MWWSLLFGFLFILFSKCFEIFVSEIKDLLKYKKGFINVIFAFLITLSCLISLNISYNKLISSLQNEAIDAYVMGNVEKIEVVKNGEVVDYHYKIIPTEYD